MAMEAKTKQAEVKQATVKDWFEDPKCVVVDRALMHAAFQVPFAGTESTLGSHRIRGLELKYHPEYRLLIGLHKGNYFFTYASNCIVNHAV